MRATNIKPGDRKSKLRHAFSLAVSLAGMALLLSGCTTIGLWTTDHRPASPPTLTLAPHTNAILVRYEEVRLGMLDPDPYAPPGSIPPPPIDPQKQKLRCTPRAYWLGDTNRPGVPPRFVDVTNAVDWNPIPVADLWMQQRIINRQDLAWLVGAPVPRIRGKTNSVEIVTYPEAGRCISAGKNAAGQRLFITNDVPRGNYYFPYSYNPLRYLFLTNAVPEHGYSAAAYGKRFWLWKDGNLIGCYRLPDYSTTEHATVVRCVATPIAMSVDLAIFGAFVGLMGMSGGGAPPCFH